MVQSHPSLKIRTHLFIFLAWIYLKLPRVNWNVLSILVWYLLLFTIHLSVLYNKIWYLNLQLVWEIRSVTVTTECKVPVSNELASIQVARKKPVRRLQQKGNKLELRLPFMDLYYKIGNIPICGINSVQRPLWIVWISLPLVVTIIILRLSTQTSLKLYQTASQGLQVNWSHRILLCSIKVSN